MSLFHVVVLLTQIQNGVLNMKSADNNNGGNGGITETLTTLQLMTVLNLSQLVVISLITFSVLGALLSRGPSAKFQQARSSAYPAVYAEKGAATGMIL